MWRGVRSIVCSEGIIARFVFIVTRIMRFICRAEGAAEKYSVKKAVANYLVKNADAKDFGVVRLFCLTSRICVDTNSQALCQLRLHDLYARVAAF